MHRPTHLPHAIRTCDAANHFAASQLFAGVGPEQLNDLATLTRATTAQDGALLFGAHDHIDAVYLLGSGAIRLASTDRDGRTLTLAILDHGSVFGESALLGDGATGIVAQAIDECRVYTIPSHRLRELIQDVPLVGVNLLRCVGSRLRRMQELSHELAYWNVHRRLAHQICLLAERYGRPTLSGDVIVARIFTHAELADMVGTSRQTVSEAITTLMRMGILDRRRRRIVVRDRPALAAFGGER